MNEKEKDSQLQAPQEANTGKHINFLEIEEGSESSGEVSNADDSERPNATKKAWQELREENNKANNT